MTIGACPRESEISAALARGHWPQACSDELRSHAAACRACAELVLLRQAFHRERSAAASEARLERPGVLWWRAQLLRRNAAIERISRPLLGAQIFAWIMCAAAGVSCLLWQTPRVFTWAAWLAAVPRSLHLDVLLPDSWGRSPWEVWLGVSMAILAALMAAVIAHLAHGGGDHTSGVRKGSS